MLNDLSKFSQIKWWIIFIIVYEGPSCDIFNDSYKWNIPYSLI